jgi:hypothetical protein
MALLASRGSAPYSARIRVLYEADDQTSPREKGIDPDILVHPGLADVQAGKDTVLDRALAFLRSATTN